MATPRSSRIQICHSQRRWWWPSLTALCLGLVTVLGTLAHDDSMPGKGKVPPHARDAMRAFAEDHHHTQHLPSQTFTPCSGGMAGDYPCHQVDLLSFLPLAQIGGGNGNDIWGWTDSGSGREFALMGLTNGTAFVEISDPQNPVYLGHLPAHAADSSWRDIKVYGDHAFIVSESVGSGVQVMGLAQLLNVPSPPVTFPETAHFSGLSTSHNIAINEETGFAYIAGTNNGNCGRGLRFLDVRDPLNPQQVGCYGDDGYTHDAQCVIYRGPDSEHRGKEICLAYNEDTLTIIDVSDKASPTQISRTGYLDVHYTHQGWLTEDHAFLLMDDELDERRLGGNTRTLMWNMADLDQPIFMGKHLGITTSIDHNQYIVGDYSFQANYRAGLRVLDISDIANGNLHEVGFFDVFPNNDSANFSGAWSVYPFFPSGTIIVSGIEQGLFILRLNLDPVADPPEVTLEQPQDGSGSLYGRIPLQIAAVDNQDLPTQLVVEWNVDGGPWQAATYDPPSDRFLAEWNAGSLADGLYTLSARATDSDFSTAVDSAVVGISNPSPVFTVDSIQVTVVEGARDRDRAEALTTLIDSSGNPMAGVRVFGQFSGDWSGERNRSSDETGQALTPTPRITGLAFVRFCVLDATLAGWVLDRENSTLCADTDGGITAVGTLAGTVTDLDTAEAIANATVMTDRGQSGTTDGSGEYSLTDVPVGDRNVSTVADGYQPDTRSAVVTEAAVTLLDIALDSGPEVGYGALTGIVKTASGSRLSGVLVNVAGGSTALTNNTGRYLIQNISEGVHQVTFSKQGFVTQTSSVTIRAGANTRLDVVL